MPIAAGAVSLTASVILGGRFSSNHCRTCTPIVSMKLNSRAGGTSGVGCGDGTRGPIDDLVDVAGGCCASAVDGAPVVSFEGPALPAEGGNPKRCSKASLEDGLADLPCASLWKAESGSSKPVAIGCWVLRVDRADRIDAVSSAPRAGSLSFFILLADSSCRAEIARFFLVPICLRAW